MKRYVIKHIPTGHYLMNNGDYDYCPYYLADENCGVFAYDSLDTAQKIYKNLPNEIPIKEDFKGELETIDKQQCKIIGWNITEVDDYVEPTALANSQHRNEYPEKKFEGFSSEEEWDEFKKHP